MRLLPLLWFLLAALGAAAQLVVSGATADAGNVYSVFSSATVALGGAIAAVGVALVYLFILRMRPSLSVAIIGYSHLFLATAARFSQAAGDLFRNRMLAGTGTTDYSTMGLAYTAAGLANVLSGIVFILALIVALNTRHERPEDVF
ncbi:MAG: hypothetical protein R3C13_02550 [Hyphomonas sp.]|uniref:hypothetical protein n=1 Tax=Hyphomonas sp. TaxID=87 RepID=UPI0035278A05